MMQTNPQQPHPPKRRRAASGHSILALALAGLAALPWPVLAAGTASSAPPLDLQLRRQSSDGPMLGAGREPALAASSPLQRQERLRSRVGHAYGMGYEARHGAPPAGVPTGRGGPGGGAAGGGGGGRGGR